MNQSQNEKIEIVDSNAFEDIIKDLKLSLTRIKSGFENEKNMMKKIDKTDIWYGVTQEKVYSKYIELGNCYSPVVESLSTYIKFLDNTINSYKNAEMVINNNIDDNTDNLIVN